MPIRPAAPRGAAISLARSSFASCTLRSWRKGRAAIDEVIREKPDVFLKVIAQVIPKEFHVRDNTLDHMSDDELAISSAQYELHKDELAPILFT